MSFADADVGSNNLHVHEEADADTAKSKLQLLQTIFEETSHKRKSPSGRVRLGSKKSPKSSAGVVKTSPTTKACLDSHLLAALYDLLLFEASVSWIVQSQLAMFASMS